LSRNAPTTPSEVEGTSGRREGTNKIAKRSSAPSIYLFERLSGGSRIV